MDDKIFIKRIFPGKTITFPSNSKKINFNFLENCIIVLFIINQIIYVTSTPIAGQHHHHHHNRDNNNNRNDLVKLKNNSGLRNLGRRVIIKQEDGGCYHNGTNFAENSYVPTMEPCLICKCANRTLICALRVCPEQPIPPPRSCVLVQGKRSCCPHISCLKMNSHYNINNHFHEPTDHHKRHVESQEQIKRSDDIDIDPFEQTTLGICIQNGTVYQTGSAMSSSSLCWYCYCIDGRQKCVKPKCMLKQNGCTPIFVKGACCPVRYDCLDQKVIDDKSTLKGSDHIIRGTIKYKGTRSPRAGGCFVNSKNYTEGQKLPVDELKPCDICFCIRGERKCTPKMCAPSIQRCTPIVRKGECCAAGYDCSNSLPITKPVIENSNKNSPRQFDFFSILFGLDELQNSTTLSSVAYPEDRTPPEGQMIEIDGGNDPDEEIEESDEQEEEPIEETTNLEVEEPNSTDITSIPTGTTEKNFFDIIREGLDMIDNHGEKIGMIIDETTPSKLNPSQVPTTTKKPPTDSNQSFLDLLLGPDDDDEYEEWKNRNKNTTSLQNVTNYPPFSPQPSGNYFPPLSYSEHEDDDRIKHPPRPTIAAFPPSFMNQARFPAIPPVKELSTQKTATVITTQPPITSTITNTPTNSTTTTTTTTTTSPKPTTTPKSSTTTTRPTTTSRKTSTIATTTTTKVMTTRPPATVITVKTTKPATITISTPTTMPTTTTMSTTTAKPTLTTSTTTRITTSMTTTKPRTATKTKTTQTAITKATAKPNKPQGQTFSIDVNTSFKLNGPANHSKPAKHTQYVQRNDTLLIIHEDIPPLVLSPAKTPGITKIISPVGDSEDYSYNDFNGHPTLPPSLPNLKIIPFLPADAVKNDRKQPPVITPYNKETGNYDSLIDKRIDYEIDNPFGINFGLNNKYHNNGGDGGSIVGDAVLDSDPTNPQSLLKYDELGGYGEHTESPYEYRFSPPTKTEGGFRPRDPDRDDTYFYNSGYHTVNFTTEAPKPNLTTSNPFNDVIKTEPAPNLLSLIEDKAKLLAKNYTDISLYDDTDDDIISITTDVNYNSNHSYPIVSNENDGFFGNVLSFLFNGENSANNLIPLQSNSDVLRNYTSGLASGQTNISKSDSTVVPPFKILPKIPENFDFNKDITPLDETTLPTTIMTIVPTTSTMRPTTMISIAPVTRTSTKMTTTTKPTEKVLAVYSMNGYQNREQTIKASPKIDNINLLFPHHHHHRPGHNNYHVLEDDTSISNTESYVVNPVDPTKLKDHNTNGQAEIFTKSNSNSLSSGFGILKLAGCNIYGRLYRVGKIISELSGPCLECKCTDIGVNCTPLSC